MTLPTLAERVVAIEGALSEIRHAFGGALALAYYAEPRATVDIDLNVFVPPGRYREVLEPLERLGAAVEDPSLAQLLLRDGQARAWWAATPIDLFLAYDAFHEAADAARRVVPFAGGTIPILSPEHLVVCKVVFGRPKDWVDIDSMLDAGTVVDAAEILRWVGRIAGDDDQRYDRIATVLTRR